MGKKQVAVEFVSRFNSALSKSETIIVGCSCEVKYSGRAESYLPQGDRVIMIKNDKTLLIHQPTGSNPVNYMKQDTVHKAVNKGDIIKLKSTNSSQKEALDIDIKDIHFIKNVPLKDGQKIQLYGNERDMAEMIMNNPSLIEEGFRVMNGEEQTRYGFVDVLGFDSDGNLTVIECKRYKGSLADVSQLRRYVEKVKESRGIKQVRGILASNGITGNARNMLENWGFEHRDIKPPKYQDRFSKDQKNLCDF